MRLLDRFVLLAAVVLVAAGVALTYFCFEAAVHGCIDYIWNNLLDTETNRLAVVPLCIILSLLFFGTQHYLDPKGEKRESKGLGEMPAPTIANFLKVIAIGFLSLIAGASLGPEAILVPACMIVGGYVGVRLFKKDKRAPKLLSMVGFIALIAAFFDSFIFGMLGLLLVSRQVGLRLNVRLVAIAAIASAVTVYVLGLLDSSAYSVTPEASWDISGAGFAMLAVLLAGGYIIPYIVDGFHRTCEVISDMIKNRSWWQRGVVAASGLSAIYLLGGPLVQFTGNDSIIPLLQKSGSLGIIGLIWISLTKIAAISWSKALGYRGGLVFPTLFVAAALVAISQQYLSDIAFVPGLIAVMAGVILADRKVKILF